MQELDILNKFKEIKCTPFQSEEEGKLEHHKKWLSTIVREYAKNELEAALIEVQSRTKEVAPK